MKIACALGVLFVALVLGTTARADAPQPFTSAALGFTATFPMAPKEAANDAGGGTVAAVDPKGIMYMVGVIPPMAENAKLSPKELLDAGIDGALAKVKGKMTSQKDIKLGKHPGREVEVEVNDGHATLRAYIVDGKVYLLVVVQKNGTTLPMPVAQFFSSFSLAKK
jgi:hypothetical protein